MSKRDSKKMDEDLVRAAIVDALSSRGCNEQLVHKVLPVLRRQLMAKVRALPKGASLQQVHDLIGKTLTDRLVTEAIMKVSIPGGHVSSRRPQSYANDPVRHIARHPRQWAFGVGAVRI